MKAARRRAGGTGEAGCHCESPLICVCLDLRQVGGSDDLTAAEADDLRASLPDR